MGSVDRNEGTPKENKPEVWVAPRMGSVDRNIKYAILSLCDYQSLPAWGAWIEIPGGWDLENRSAASLPAWGAWIEIDMPENMLQTPQGRSPHGERG